MSLTLHELTHSAFCIPVRRILDAYGIAYDRIEVSSWDRRELAQLTLGDYYQVPVIEDEDVVVHETELDPMAVAHYLNVNFARNELFPAHCRGIHEIVIAYIEDTLEGIGSRLSDPGYVDTIEDLGERTMVIRHKERKLGVGCVKQWRSNADEIAQQFEAALQLLEIRLAEIPYLFGNHPVYADYALFGVLGNAQFGGHYQLAETLPKLKQWQSNLEKFSIAE